MTKFFLLPMILFGLIASAAAAQHHPAPQGTGDGRFAPVVLGVGDEYGLPEGSVLEFVDLLDDSRCPADAMCVWQGQALLRFRYDGEAFLVTFTGPDHAPIDLGRYSLQVLDVQPYPLASAPHDPADTRVTVRLVSTHG